MDSSRQAPGSRSSQLNSDVWDSKCEAMAERDNHWKFKQNAYVRPQLKSTLGLVVLGLVVETAPRVRVCGVGLVYEMPSEIGVTGASTGRVAGGLTAGAARDSLIHGKAAQPGSRE